MAVVHQPALKRVEAPECSVCIANYNGETLLAECIDSVLAQQGVGEVEIIVHDDCSADRSLAVLREHYPQVELLASDHNVGFCVANNRMVAAARGRFVLLLNNDAVLFPDALATLLRESAATEEPLILSLPQRDYTSGSLVDLGMLLDPFHTPTPNTDPARPEVAYVIGACLFIERALWMRLGGFPAWFGSIAEDLYLCALARLAGARVKVPNASGYRHRQGVSFGGNRISERGVHTTFRRRHLSERNRLFVLLIASPWPLLLPALLASVVALSLEALALCAIRRQWRPMAQIYWPALRDVLAHRREWLAARRQAQGQRIIGTRAYLRGFTLTPRKLAVLFRYGPPELA